MIDIVCMKFGTKYGPEYVNILRRGVARNLSQAHRFVCFTDNPSGLDTATNPEIRPDLGGWWNKLWIFSAWTPRRQLALDIDDPVTGSLDELASWPGRGHLVLSNWYKPDEIAGAVHVLDPGFHRHELWVEFCERGEAIKAEFRSDQEFYTARIKDSPRIQEFLPDQVISYKKHCQGIGLPPNARIVCFHGTPKPPEVIAVGRPEDAWVKEHWR